jgi:hypothetical protein
MTSLEPTRAKSVQHPPHADGGSGTRSPSERKEPAKTSSRGAAHSSPDPMYATDRYRLMNPIKLHF